MNGPFHELAYFYANVFVGTPPQKATVIADTGSTRLAFPCVSCGANCGTHMDPHVDPLQSSTASPTSCSACSPCNSRNQCTYSVHYAEGSSIAGVLYDDLVWMGSITSEQSVGEQYGVRYRFGCHTSETSTSPCRHRRCSPPR